MPLDFIDGFDQYLAGNVTAVIGSPYISNSSGGSLQFNAVGAANGVNCLSAANGGTSECSAERLFSSAATSVFIGCNFATAAVEGIVASNANITGFQLCADGDRNNGDRYTICPITASGKFELFRNFTSIATSQQNVIANTYYRLKMHYSVDAFGNAELLAMINDEVLFNDTITPLGANPWTADRIRMGSSGTSTTYRYDDIFAFINPTAPEITTLTNLPAWGVFDAIPDANGLNQDWSVVVAPSAWQAIANRPYNLTEYIEASNLNDVSDFTLASPNPGTSQIVQILGAMHYYYAEKSDAAAGSVQATFNGGAGANNPLAETPVYYFDVYQNNPATGMPWTQSDLSTLTNSFERTA